MNKINKRATSVLVVLISVLACFGATLPYQRLNEAIATVNQSLPIQTVAKHVYPYDPKTNGSRYFIERVDSVNEPQIAVFGRTHGPPPCRPCVVEHDGKIHVAPRAAMEQPLL